MRSGGTPVTMVAPFPPALLSFPLASPCATPRSGATTTFERRTGTQAVSGISTRARPSPRPEARGPAAPTCTGRVLRFASSFTRSGRHRFLRAPCVQSVSPDLCAQVCSYPPAAENCPVACETRQECFPGRRAPVPTFLAWDRIQRIEKPGDSKGTICLGSHLSADEVEKSFLCRVEKMGRCHAFYSCRLARRCRRTRR